MAELNIFIDEAGTMPEKESEGVFVIAAVATINNFPDIAPFSGPSSGLNQGLVEKLGQYSCRPFVVYVKPTAEYGNRFQQKIEEMDIMARTTRLITGANAPYLTNRHGRGFNSRDFMWIECVGLAIAQIVIGEIFENNRIECIKIFIDEKSLSESSKNLLLDTVHKKVKEVLDAILTKAQLTYPRHALALEAVKDSIAFTRNTVSLNWINEPEAKKARGGLILAHHLATASFRGLSTTDNPTIKQLIESTGFHDCFTDYTDELLGPLSQETVNTWERNTGLSRPKIS